MSTKLKLLGVDVASVGDAHAATPGARAYSFVDERREVYKKLVVSEDGSRLLGAVLVGDTDAYGTLSADHAQWPAAARVSRGVDSATARRAARHRPAPADLPRCPPMPRSVRATT